MAVICRGIVLICLQERIWIRHCSGRAEVQVVFIFPVGKGLGDSGRKAVVDLTLMAAIRA